MQTKNIGLLLNRQVPVKIYYLKDEGPKYVHEQQQEKPSLPFLSSIIQDQKRKNHFHKQQSNDLMYPTQIGNYEPQSKKIVKQPKIIKIARNNRILQKRSLSYMLNQPLQMHPKQQMLKTLSRSKQSPQNITVDQQLRYSVNFNNRTLMGQQFNNMIASVKTVPKPQKRSNSNIQKNQIINRDRLKSTNLHSTLEQNSNQQLLNFERNTISREKPSTTNPAKRRRIFVNSIMAKKNFKIINNFQWSKLQASRNFIILTQNNDCS